MKTVFTNGCFDILHRGHVELLRFCANLGDRVVVGINSDKSVGKIKGDDRPVNFQEDRKLILESIKYVDSVIIFEEETPYELIKLINPDIIVKGGDYNKENVVGNDISKVVIFDYIENYSTTKTIKDISNR